MDRTKQSLSGKSLRRSQIRPPLIIDPRLLSWNERLLHATSPSVAPAVPATAWNSALEQPGFHKFCPDDIGVDSNISPQSDLDSYKPSEISLTYPAKNLNRVDHTALSPTTGNIESLVYNDFDAAFGDFNSTQDGQIVDANAISYLSLWIAKNNSTQPSVKQLKALETLTEVPIRRLSEWLKCHGKALLVNSTSALSYAQLSSSTEEPYRVRCVESGFRYRSPKTEVSARKIFECTNRCGQTFQRKGDWSRHEKVNFEEWPCSRCGKVLTRCEHLQKHFKDAHPGERDISKFQKRQILKAEQRPCGFCNDTLTNWSAWLAHVASHFEGGPGGRSRDMVQWREYQPSSPSDLQYCTSRVPEQELYRPESGPSKSSKVQLRIGQVETEMSSTSRIEEAFEISGRRLEGEYEGRQGAQDWEHERHKRSMTRVQEEPEEQFLAPWQSDSSESEDTGHASPPSLDRTTVFSAGADCDSRDALTPDHILIGMLPTSDSIAMNAKQPSYSSHLSLTSEDEIDQLTERYERATITSRTRPDSARPRHTERDRSRTST